MIRKALILKIFGAFYMERWNDRLRPMSFIEMDKQAHKMIIAYFLGKFEESSPDFDWIKIIEGGIFELLHRVVITDIKPPVLYQIKSNRENYKKLNDYVYDTLKPFLTPLDEGFALRFQEYLNESEDSICRKVLSAAHAYASRWEFNLIRRVNPDNYDNESIESDFAQKINQYRELQGIRLLEDNPANRNFIQLCGQLRFQYRWAQIHRIPKTSVLGHSLFVAILSYLFSLRIDGCAKRKYNNFFSGLFHDLPEVLTRDIISPVKRSVEGLSELIKKYEKEQLEKVLYPLLPDRFHAEIADFCENEFDNYIHQNGERKTVPNADITCLYNEDGYNPRDGELVKACDDLSAYIEAEIAIENGCVSEEFHKAMHYIRTKYERKNIASIDFGEIYSDF